MSDVFKEFKDFISRGNVVDLAVAVVIGAAFTQVVNSFANDVLLQVIPVVVGEPDFSDLTIELGKGKIRYGAFLTAMVSFLIIAVGVFLVVKAINAFHRREEPEEGQPQPTEIELLAEIRDELRSSRSR